MLWLGSKKPYKLLWVWKVVLNKPVAMLMSLINQIVQGEESDDEDN